MTYSIGFRIENTKHTNPIRQETSPLVNLRSTREQRLFSSLQLFLFEQTKKKSLFHIHLFPFYQNVLFNSVAALSIALESNVPVGVIKQNVNVLVPACNVGSFSEHQN